MKKIKKLWQGIFLTVLAGMFFPFVDITVLTFPEYMALVMFAVNIILEVLDVCTEE